MSAGINQREFCARCGERLLKHKDSGQYIFVLVQRPDGEVRMHVECALREKNDARQTTNTVQKKAPE